MVPTLHESFQKPHCYCCCRRFYLVLPATLLLASSNPCLCHSVCLSHVRYSQRAQLTLCICLICLATHKSTRLVQLICLPGASEHRRPRCVACTCLNITSARRLEGFYILLAGNNLLLLCDLPVAAYDCEISK